VYETIFICLVAALLCLEAKRFEPKPVPLGAGDTLMVRIVGYEFCPKYCDVDHFHIGHKKNYNCEEEICEHIIYEYKTN